MKFFTMGNMTLDDFTKYVNKRGNVLCSMCGDNASVLNAIKYRQKI